MVQVTIIKDYKKLKVGDKPTVDDAYAAILAKKGVIAKQAKEEKK